MTSRKRWLAIAAWTGLAVGLLPTIGYLWTDVAQGAIPDSTILRELYHALFLPSGPVEFLLRSLGFDIYFVEAHGPTIHTYRMWTLVCVTSLAFWLVVSVGIAAAWKYARGRGARLEAAGES